MRVSQPAVSAYHQETVVADCVDSSTLHLLTAGMAIHQLLKFTAVPKAEATCPDCQRKWHRGDARSKDGAEDSLLAVHDYDEDADGA